VRSLLKKLKLNFKQNMVNLNKVMIMGNLCRDPELKALPSGANVANMSIATNRVWNDKEGNKQEEVEFHNIVVFGKQAEIDSRLSRGD